MQGLQGRLPGRVDVDRGHPAQEAVGLEQVDGAVVGEVGHRQAGDLVERGGHVGQRGQFVAGAGEELPVQGLLPLVGPVPQDGEEALVRPEAVLQGQGLARSPEGGAVAPQVPAFVDRAALPAGDVQLARRDAGRPVLEGVEHLHPLAEHLILTPAGQPGGADVPGGDAAVFQAGDDGVVHRAAHDVPVVRVGQRRRRHRTLLGLRCKLDRPVVLGDDLRLSGGCGAQRILAVPVRRRSLLLRRRILGRGFGHGASQPVGKGVPA